MPIAPELLPSNWLPPQICEPCTMVSGKPDAVRSMPAVYQPEMNPLTSECALLANRCPRPNGNSYTKLLLKICVTWSAEGAYSASRSKELGTGPALFCTAPNWSSEREKV